MEIFHGAVKKGTHASRREVDNPLKLTKGGDKRKIEKGLLMN